MRTVKGKPNDIGKNARTFISSGLDCLSESNEMGSLFKNIPAEIPEEIIETICSTGNVTIERIVSRRHASPDGYWYDQDRNEFVLVVKGRAGLKFDGEDEIVVLKAGDYLNIAAHQKHRVEWTDAASDTIWLAVHY